MQVQVYDYRWRQVEDEFYCEFEANAGGKFGAKRIKRGDTLSLEVKSESRCAGFMENGKWGKCKKNSDGKPKCDYCRSIEGNFVYTAFDGFDQSSLSAGDLEKISGEHWVYLALFAENMVKIGVSKKPRKLLRQVEQGSFATLFVAQTPDGVAARQIETLLRKSGLQDKIKSSQKKEFLCPEVTDPETVLKNILKNHKTALSEYSHLEAFLLENPEFYNWQEQYGLANCQSNFHDVKLDTDEWVSGEVVALKGPFIVLKTPEELVSICAKDFRGREVEFEPKPAGMQLKAAFQGALF